MTRHRRDPVRLGTSESSLQAVALGYQLRYYELALLNGSDAAVTANMWFVPSGGSAGDANKILEYSVRAKDTRVCDGTPFLNAEDQVIMTASEADAVVAHLAVLGEGQ
ncbi:MAG: hypothetical protein OXC19_06185 [Bryobacterales bacterium]|nr:hypothetical protein [Bryobacterales bacterium]